MDEQWGTVVFFQLSVPPIGVTAPSDVRHFLYLSFEALSLNFWLDEIEILSIYGVFKYFLEGLLHLSSLF